MSKFNGDPKRANQDNAGAEGGNVPRLMLYVGANDGTGKLFPLSVDPETRELLVQATVSAIGGTVTVIQSDPTLLKATARMEQGVTMLVVNSPTNFSTTSGVPARLAAAAGTKVAVMEIQALSTNQANVFVGGSLVSASQKIGLELAPGDVHTIHMIAGTAFDPYTEWLDVEHDGDGVTVTQYELP